MMTSESKPSFVPPKKLQGHDQKKNFISLSLKIVVFFVGIFILIALGTTYFISQRPVELVEVPVNLAGKVAVTEVALLGTVEAEAKYGAKDPPDPGSRFVHISFQVAYSVVPAQGEGTYISAHLADGLKVFPTRSFTTVSIENDRVIQEDSATASILFTVPTKVKYFDVLCGKLPLFKINISALNTEKKQ